MADDFPLLRNSLASQYAGADPAQLDAIVRQIYGEDASAEDVESFFGDLGHGLSHAAGAVGHFAQTAAPMVAKALPSMAQGAMSGASVAGPWGALAGAVAGGASGILSQSSNRTARQIGGGIGTISNLVSTVRGGGAGGALGALGSLAGGLGGKGANPLAGLAGGGGANGLMALLSRPEALQALQAGALGVFGRPTVPVGSQPVPVHLLLNALGTLAQRSAHEAAEASGADETLPWHFSEAGEAFGLDTDDAEGRTDTLLTLLALSPAIFNNSAAQRPVTVNVAPGDPAAAPAPPIVTAGEAVWIAESDEDYAIEDWESDEAGWDEAGWEEAGSDEAGSDEANWDETEPMYV